MSSVLLENVAYMVVLVPSANVTLLAAEPSRSFFWPNEVSRAMRSIVSSALSISAWLAAMEVASWTPRLAESIVSSRMWMRMLLTSARAASAVWTSEVARSTFSTAWFRPAICAR